MYNVIKISNSLNSIQFIGWFLFFRKQANALPRGNKSCIEIEREKSDGKKRFDLY